MTATPRPIEVPESPPAPLAPTRSRQRHQVNTKNPNWTPQEDEILRKIKSSNENPKWTDIMHFFPSKTQHQINERWEKVLNPELVKGSWTREEDELIVAWVHENGTKEWGALAAQLPGRISKQCRERWHNHLCPSVKKTDWTEEEDKILIECQAKWGNKWSKIAELLPGRTDNSVKNRWNSSLKRRLERIQNGQEPNAKRGRKPKRLSEPPSIEVLKASNEELKVSAPSTEITISQKPEPTASIATIKETDDIPKPISFETSALKLTLPTPERSLTNFSPIQISPGFAMWSPSIPTLNVTPTWGALLSPMRHSGELLNQADLMNIPEPKFDE